MKKIAIFSQKVIYLVSSVIFNLCAVFYLEFSSTPIMNQSEKLDFDVVSPIRMEIGDGESHAYSNPSSRGISPKRMPASVQSGNNLVNLVI